MSDACEVCGTTHTVEEYRGSTLCAPHRLDRRLDDGDFSEGDSPDAVQCEECNAYMDERNSNTETVDGGKGNTETLAFCDDCSGGGS